MDNILLVDNSCNAFYRRNAKIIWFNHYNPDISYENFNWL